MNKEITTNTTLLSVPKIEPCCAYVLRLFPKPCIPLKRHECRICGTWIEAKEPCCRWDGIIQGQGRFTSHAHPECYAVTEGWDSGDWESTRCGDIERPEITMSWHNAEVSHGANNQKS